MSTYTVAAKCGIVGEIIPPVEADTRDEAIDKANRQIMEVLESRLLPTHGRVAIYIEDTFAGKLRN